MTEFTRKQLADALAAFSPIEDAQGRQIVHVSMTADRRDYIVSALKAQEPHEVAETIARGIEPKASVPAYEEVKTKRQALHWAAGVARSMFPAPKPKGNDP